MENAWNGGLVNTAWYTKKTAIRPATFRFIEQLFQKLGVRSMLEIGGGTAYLAQYVERYTGIELNDTIVKTAESQPNATMIIGDWMEIDHGPMVGQFDVVAALNVLQHCEDYKAFIRKVLEVRPRLVLFSFFSYMSFGRDHIRKRKIGNVSSSFRQGATYFSNLYSRDRMRHFLDSMPETMGRHSFRAFDRLDGGREHLLMIEPRYEAGPC